MSYESLMQTFNIQTQHIHHYLIKLQNVFYSTNQCNMLPPTELFVHFAIVYRFYDPSFIIFIDMYSPLDNATCKTGTMPKSTDSEIVSMYNILIKTISLPNCDVTVSLMPKCVILKAMLKLIVKHRLHA